MERKKTVRKYKNPIGITYKVNKRDKTTREDIKEILVSE